MNRLLKCFCGNHYEAREADIKRGWAKSCSKSCAAIKRKYGRQNAVCAITGDKIAWGKKYKRPNDPIDKRYGERAAERERIAKMEGYWPFDSADEMYAEMCDDPLEGR